MDQRHHKGGATMSLFRCPNCGAALTRGERTYTCPTGHSFDRAAAGYVYLLPVNQKHSAAPGDDAGMAAARRDFLAKGFYRPLQDALAQLAVQHTGEAPAILDTGCGEGSYTAAIYRALCDAGRHPQMAGTDISKFILKTAAKREHAIEWAVASSYSLPLADSSVDLLVNCFSPQATEEFFRILRPGGTLLYVVPAADHLWDLKQVLYDQPYPNEEKEIPYDGFTCECVVPVEDRLVLENRTDIHNLFQMTPYYWKTPQAGAARLAALERLETRIAFHIHVFTRNP